MLQEPRDEVRRTRHPKSSQTGALNILTVVCEIYQLASSFNLEMPSRKRLQLDVGSIQHECKSSSWGSLGFSTSMFPQ